MSSIWFPASDPRLRTVSSKRGPQAIEFTGGERGFIVFGPHIFLPDGSYEAKLRAASYLHVTGSVRMEVSVLRGKQVVACRSFGAGGATEFLELRLPFTLIEDAHGLEVRLYSELGVVGALDGLEIRLLPRESRPAAWFSASDPRLRTVGSKRGVEAIEFTGRERGHIIFGPYIHLPEGSYEAHLHVPPEGRLIGSVRMEVSIHNGAKIIASHSYNPSDRTRIAELRLPFTLREDAYGLEVRLHTERGLSGAIAGLEIRSLSRERLRPSASTPDEFSIPETTLGTLGFERSREFAPRLDPTRTTEGVELDQFGMTYLHSLRGNILKFAGIEAFRIRLRADAPVPTMEVALDGAVLTRVNSQRVTREAARGTLWIGMFNGWVDFRAAPPGLHFLKLRFLDGQRVFRELEEIVFVGEFGEADASGAASPTGEAAFSSQADVEAYVRGRASQIHSTRRRFFDRTPERVLIIRADQLGDLIISIPAIERLKKMMPEAEFTGLLSKASLDLAETLGLFDRIVPIAFDIDPERGIKCASVAEQMRIADELKPFRFDLAIDLCMSSESRPLLRLAGAAVLAGFGPREFSWLDIAVTSSSQDLPRRGQRMPVAAATMALADAIGRALIYEPPNIPAPRVEAGFLSRFGVAGVPYALLHAGARLPYQRWPIEDFLQVAARILAETELHVVMMCDAEARSAVEAAGYPAERFHVVIGNVAFAEFDQLVAQCSVMVGNDSGPKHLGALRGSKVVSIHTGRTDWRELGQDGDGLIVARNIPCMNCGAESTEECGKNFACLHDIKVEEVYAAVKQLLAESA